MKTTVYHRNKEIPFLCLIWAPETLTHDVELFICKKDFKADVYRELSATNNRKLTPIKAKCNSDEEISIVKPLDWLINRLVLINNGKIKGIQAISTI